MVETVSFEPGIKGYGVTYGQCDAGPTITLAAFTLVNATPIHGGMARLSWPG